METLARLTWWQLVVVCLPFAVIMAVDTLGWRFAFPRDPAPFHRLYGARLAGEALNLVTAFGSVGGEAVKAWLIRRDVSYEESVPSVVIDKTTLTIAQALFLLIGVALAWALLATDSRVLGAMLWLLVVEVAAVAGFVGVQADGHRGPGRPVARVDRCPQARRLRAAARRRPARVLPAGLAAALALDGFHLAGWLLGALEAYLILTFLEIPADLATATVIEALGAGVRFATFLVPASLGAFGARTRWPSRRWGSEPAPDSRSASCDARGSSRGPSSACSCSCPWLALQAPQLQDTISTGTSSSTST